MKKTSLALVLALTASTAFAEDFVQCWSEGISDPATIVRVNVDHEVEQLREASVSYGVESFFEGQAAGLVEDERITLSFMKDGVIYGDLNAAALPDHPYLLQGELVLRTSLATDEEETFIQQRVDCLRHFLGD